MKLFASHLYINDYVKFCQGLSEKKATNIVTFRYIRIYIVGCKSFVARAVGCFKFFSPKENK